MAVLKTFQRLLLPVNRGWRRLLAALIVLLPLLAFPRPAYAFHRLNVTVTITRVTNRLVFCFDPLVVGCSRPDYYAVVNIRGNSKQAAASFSFRNQFVLNRDTATPTGWTFSYTIDNPIVEVSIFDFDGGLAGLVDGDDPADIVTGPGRTLVIPVTSTGTTPVISTGDDTDIVVIITATREPAEMSQVTGVPAAFDPSLGENMVISGNVDHDARIQMWLNGSQGGGQIADFNASGPFKFTWNGTFLGGNPVVPGQYDIMVSAEGGTPVINGPCVPNPSSFLFCIIKGIRILKRPPNTLFLLASFPVTSKERTFYPQAGSLRMDFSISSPAVVEMDIGSGASCPVTTSLATVTSTSLNPGTSSLTWDGTLATPSGTQFAPPGQYVAELTSAFTNGQPNTLPNPCLKFEIIPPPPLDLAVEHSPTVAMLGEGMTFTATAVDGNQADRLTGGIEVWVADVLAVSAHRPPTQPAMVCQQSKTCTFNTITATPTTGQLAYKARAYDINGQFVETPWRMVDVIGQTKLGSDAIVMADVPMDFGPNPPSEFFGRFDSRKTKDIVFFPGSFSMEPEGEFGLFRSLIGDYIHQAWGLGPDGRFPSSLLRHQRNVSFWVALKTVSITQSIPNNPQDPNNKCSYGAPNPSWADAGGVVHRIDCRDNANRFYKIFSADAPSVGWHELHHALFGLADEYCCDGGYGADPPLLNVYSSHADCTADPLSGASGGLTCQPIRDNNIPGCKISGASGSLQGYRLDPDNDLCVNNTEDVMILNIFEFSADTRQAEAVFRDCDQGKC